MESCMTEWLKEKFHKAIITDRVTIIYFFIYPKDLIMGTMPQITLTCPQYQIFLKIQDEIYQTAFYAFWPFILFLEHIGQRNQHINETIRLMQIFNQLFKKEAVKSPKYMGVMKSFIGDTYTHDSILFE
jgi:hypothetical protein